MHKIYIKYNKNIEFFVSLLTYNCWLEAIVDKCSFVCGFSISSSNLQGGEIGPSVPDIKGFPLCILEGKYRNVKFQSSDEIYRNNVVWTSKRKLPTYIFKQFWFFWQQKRTDSMRFSISNSFHGVKFRKITKIQNIKRQ